MLTLFLNFQKYFLVFYIAVSKVHNIIIIIIIITASILLAFIKKVFPAYSREGEIK